MKVEEEEDAKKGDDDVEEIEDPVSCSSEMVSLMLLFIPYKFQSSIQSSFLNSFSLTIMTLLNEVEQPKSYNEGNKHKVYTNFELQSFSKDDLTISLNNAS